MLRAVTIAQEIRKGHLSASEVVDAHWRQIHRFNPEVNALVTLDEEGSRHAAKLADDAQARGEPMGPLHGLPVAHKDNQLTAGMRTTYGSTVYRNHIPREDSIVVARQRAAGAIALGKTNLPEFAAGSHTFNTLFGVTRNPYDLSKSAGGSSGGAAAALAAGFVALADGTDMGGSLRNPASFCNVVGLRPSAGRVAQWPVSSGWPGLSVAGPMARTVRDAALFMSVLADGSDPRDPVSLPVRFQDAVQLERDLRGVRVAYAPDFGGLPVEDEVRVVIQQAALQLESFGCSVELDCPSLEVADEVFSTLRALSFAAGYGPVLREHGDQIKETVHWNVRLGEECTGGQAAAAQRMQIRLFGDMQQFLNRYDFLIGPVSQVAPFPAELEYPAVIGTVQMSTYIEWMRSCSRVTATGHPAISVPCGFTAAGLPVGLQIVGRYRDELGLLQMAYAVEQSLRMYERRPSIRKLS